jgi:Tfp pilus assembly protein FimV
MRRTIARVTVWGAIAAGLIHTLSAQALGLGDISVDSLLNQRFSAVIPLN